jgi:signal transduction histidine kinase
MRSLRVRTRDVLMKTKAKTNGKYTEGPFSVETPRDQSQEKGDQGPDFLGKSLESIIAGVAVERTRADEALRALTGRLIEAQEMERRRLARELHDGLNQQLAMLTMELGMLATKIPEDASTVRVQLFTLRDRAERLSNDLRHMTHQLHPAALEHLGLVSALRSHCAELSRHEGMRVWFHVSTEVRSTNQDVAVCLYRIAQEAIRNAAKHSHSKEVWVEIGQYRDVIRLSIVDKGVGFDWSALKVVPGLGLVSMRERVELISGALTIKSAPGEGTCVEVRIPAVSRRQMNSKRRNYAKSKTAAG